MSEPVPERPESDPQPPTNTNHPEGAAPGDPGLQPPMPSPQNPQQPGNPYLQQPGSPYQQQQPANPYQQQPGQQGWPQGQQPYMQQQPYPGQQPNMQQQPYPGQQPYQQQPHGQPGYPQHYGQQPYGYPGTEQKSRLAAGLLGILLGGLGIHRFYLGYTAIGILQIVVTVLTGGIGGLWGLIEGIMILVGSSSFRADARGVPLKE
ncbi:NINE protein [Paeniglutamicibacter sp. NPDC012692]|uniref:NINE protein n=1 Tax=Paeniglutamicibacter sp. NPDC012692 TaxID=3364388 RepID=UPI0036D0729E